MNLKQMLFDFGSLANVKRDRSNAAYIADSLSKSSTGEIRLMSRIAQRVEDKRVLKLIRAFLNSGTQINDIVEYSHEGTPQGGPLSPLLSNIVLDELDKELEKRGLRFVRYADDLVILVRSPKAAESVLASASRYITGKLKLKVNEQKSGSFREQRWPT